MTQQSSNEEVKYKFWTNWMRYLPEILTIFRKNVKNILQFFGILSDQTPAWQQNCWTWGFLPANNTWWVFVYTKSGRLSNYWINFSDQPGVLLVSTKYWSHLVSICNLLAVDWYHCAGEYLRQLQNRIISENNLNLFVLNSWLSKQLSLDHNLLGICL